MTVESVEGAPTAPADVRWPGVVVIGGGVTGLLTALELERRGVSALLIEQGTLCSGQTGECHGWLHRGAVFLDASVHEMNELNRGADRWEHLLNHRDSAINCRIAGSRDETRADVIAAWNRFGLPYRSAPNESVTSRWMLDGPETAVVPRDVLKNIVLESNITLRCARALSLQPSADGKAAETLLVAVGERTLRLSAAAFVVAAGADIGMLLPCVRHLTRRLSFMLVARSTAVGQAGIAIPEQEALGLFAVPRTDGRRRFLLISNFMSYAPTAETGLVRTSWLSGMRATIIRFLPDLWAADDALWGVYPAIKVESARDLALGLPGSLPVPTPYQNVVAAVPGKLTLAPLIATRLAATVAPFAPVLSGGHRVKRVSEAVLRGLPPARWGPEGWQVTPLVRRATLFGEAGEA